MNTSWKTTVLGILTAFFAFVVFDPQYFPLWLLSLAKFAAAGGLAGLGLVAKDHNMTGGTKGPGATAGLLIFGLLCLGPMSVPAMAQTAQQPPIDWVAAGASWTSTGSPQIQGTLSWAHQVGIDKYTYVTADLNPIFTTTVVNGTKKVALSGIKYSFRAGGFSRFATLGRIPIYGFGNAGIATTAVSTGGSFAGGIGTAKVLGKGWILFITGRGQYDTISGLHPAIELDFAHSITKQ